MYITFLLFLCCTSFHIVLPVSFIYFLSDDDECFDATTRAYICNGVALATRKRYQSGIQRWLSFCQRNSITAGDFGRLNQFLQLQLLTDFLRERMESDGGVSASTLKLLVSSISFWYSSNGQLEPCSLRSKTLKLFLKGAAPRGRARNLKAQQRGKRLPFTLDMLEWVRIRYWGDGSYLNNREGATKGMLYIGLLLFLKQEHMD